MQAQEANAALGVLEERLDGAGSRAERVAAFEAAYRHVAQWRYEVAVEGRWQRPGASAEDVRTPLAPGSGYRVTPDNWLPDRDTPAFKMLKKLEQVGLDRLAGETSLQNRVTLRDGRRVNGNTLGLQPGRYRFTGEVIEGSVEVAMTYAEAGDREVLRQAAFEALAELEEARAGAGTDPQDPEQRQTFVDAAYFLVQGPEFQRGSDAIMRTFIAAAHTRVFDAAPVLPQAIDLDGMVRGQDGFSQVMHEQLRIAKSPAAQPGADVGAERPAVHSPHRREGLGR
ncbi:hypothetical protein [Kribbella sp. NPDC004536]|uniref:hypothetical protein n=1 Tax=Kribbella sp. NPDC004536 TaxID=3364106 RepID=UPI003687CB66